MPYKDIKTYDKMTGNKKKRKMIILHELDI